MRWLLRSATSAKPPLGSIATSIGPLKEAIGVLHDSKKPLKPLPASVVVAPVAMSTRRIRLLP